MRNRHHRADRSATVGGEETARSPAETRDGWISGLRFLRTVTWRRVSQEAPPELARATAAIGRGEGMEGHAVTAEFALRDLKPSAKLAANDKPKTMKLVRLPRLRLAHLPTPLEPMPRLRDAMDGPGLWIKRSDCTGHSTGGNKTREPGFLMPEAQEQAADIVLTPGAAQS